MTAMAVGVATFALVNLLLISQLLAVLEDRPAWPPSTCSARAAARWSAGPARPPPAGASCWSRAWSPRAGTWA